MKEYIIIPIAIIAIAWIISLIIKTRRYNNDLNRQKDELYSQWEKQNKQFNSKQNENKSN